MKNAFIIHDAYGSSEENWFPWLKKELEELDYEVFVPDFPTPQGQTLENWREVFDVYKEFINEETIFIGHSLGPLFILDILQKLNMTVKASFFVSGFLRLLGNKEFDTINKTFVENNFDWDKISANCKQFIIFHSDNDPYVPIKYANELAETLATVPIIIKGAGHFNSAAAYNKFEELLDKIKELK